MKANSGQASSTLIPEYIGSAFDKVITVADNMETVTEVVNNLDNIKTADNNLGSINTVVDNITDVVTVGNNINYVKDVAERIEGLPVTSYIGNTPPTQPLNGAEWYCTTDGRTYVWYVDTDSSQWVESSPQSAPQNEVANIFFHATPSNVNSSYRNATLFDTLSPEAEISVAHNALNTPVVQAQFIREEALWDDVSVIGAQGIVTLIGYSSGNSQLKVEIITWKNGAEGTSLGTSQWVTLPNQPSVVSLPVTLANIDVLDAGDSYVVRLTSQMNAGSSAVSTILVDGNTRSRFEIIFNTNLIGLFNGIRDGVITSAPTENAVYDALQLKAVKTDVSNALNLKVGKGQLVQYGNLIPAADWADIPAYADSELGGLNGPLNKQAKALTARSELLRTDVREAMHRIAAVVEETNDNLAAHNADYFAHPKLTEQIAAEVHRAEIAADVAQLSAGIYSSTSEGIAATTSGKYFSVPSADSDEYLILYKNNSGTAVEVKRYPSADRVKKVDLVSTKVDYEQRIYKNKSATNASETFARQKMDDIGDVPNSLQNKIYAAGGEVAIGSLDAAGKLIAGVGEMGLIAGNNSIQDREPKGSEVYAIVDDSSRASFVIREGGLVDVATRKPWDLPEVTHIISYGQSLSIGVKGTPIISTTQPYDNLMFNNGVQPGTDPADVVSFVPLIEQAQDGGGYETVLSGCCNRLVELGNNTQFLGSATGIGNTPISGLIKGTAGYTKTLFVRDPAVTCSAAIDKTYSMGAFLWLQGEADVSSMFSPFFPTQYKQYKAQLAQLWRDLNADFSDCNTIGSAIPLISYQLSFNSLSVNADGVTQAQLDVSNEFDHIYCAGPTYNLTYSEDKIHLSGPSYYIYGHYFARALNEIINGRDWKPLHIKSARRSGKGLLLKYHVPHGPLVIDPFKGVETTDHGFAVYDTNGNKLTISSVTAVTEDAIKILLSETPTGPVAIKYARNYSNGKCNGTGVATGDVRDSSDEIATYKISTTTYNVNLYNYACHQTIWSN